MLHDADTKNIEVAMEVIFPMKQIFEIYIKLLTFSSVSVRES